MKSLLDAINPSTDIEIFVDSLNIKPSQYFKLAPKILEIHHSPEDDNDLELINELEEVKSEEDVEAKDDQEQFAINKIIQLTACDQPSLNAEEKEKLFQSLHEHNVYLAIAEVFKQLSKPQEVKNLENLKSLSEIAGFILTFSEDNINHGYYVFDSVLAASLLYS